MTGSRLVRGTRSRLFLYIGVVAVVGLAIYVFHRAQVQLDDSRKIADKCQLQQESLSAQLQVIFEYKLRLEKSLQQEKTEHRQTREELESRVNEERNLHDKENLEAGNKYSALQQQYKLLQSQHEDLNEDCNKIRVTQLQGLEERSKLESQLQAIRAELAQVQAGHKKSLNSLKTEFLKLEVENGELQKQNSDLLKETSQTSDKIKYLEKQNLQLQRELSILKKELESHQRNFPLDRLAERKPSENVAHESLLRDSNKVVPSPSSPSSVSSPALAQALVVGLNADNQVNVLQEPLLNVENADNKMSVQRTTTPQVNPEAVLSQEKSHQSNNVAPVPPPRQEKEQLHHEIPNLPKPAVETWRHANLPAGVVPAPHGYGYHNMQDGAVNRNEERAADHWGFPRFGHMAQPIDPAYAKHNNPLDENGPEEGEEEEEKEDQAHPHRSAHGEQQELPKQLHNPYHYNGADYDKEGPRGDLQLEEGEEEEDDDVDQIDYGNEAGGDGAKHKIVGGLAHKQSLINANKKPHDGVMVNPK